MVFKTGNINILVKPFLRRNTMSLRNLSIRYQKYKIINCIEPSEHEQELFHAINSCSYMIGIFTYLTSLVFTIISTCYAKLETSSRAVLKFREAESQNSQPNWCIGLTTGTLPIETSSLRYFPFRLSSTKLQLGFPKSPWHPTTKYST